MVLLVNEVDEADYDDLDRPPYAARRHLVGRLVAAAILFVLIAGPIAQVLRWY